MTTPTPTPAVWSDGDPLMTAIAAAVSAQCQTHPEQGLTVDDPRTIAAVAATVARQVLGTPTTDTTARGIPGPSAPLLTATPADEIALLRTTLRAVEEGRAELRAENARLRAQAQEQPASAPAAPADRATDRRDRWEAAAHAAGREVDRNTLAAYMAVADAEQAELRAELDEQLRTDRATALREAAALLVDHAATLEALSSSDYDNEAFAASHLRTKAVDLHRLADEAQPTPCVSASCPHPGDCRHGCRAAADELSRETQGATAAVPFLTPEEEARLEAKWTAAQADHEPATAATEAARCTCADAGPAFAPAGHYADCPHAATAATDDGDPICGDRYDDETCELEPGHPGAHCAGIVCWDYGRAPATAATEEHRPPCTDGDHCGETAHCPPETPATDAGSVLRRAADDLEHAFGDPMAKHIGALGASWLRRRARALEADAPATAATEEPQP